MDLAVKTNLLILLALLPMGCAASRRISTGTQVVSGSHSSRRSVYHYM